MYGFGLVAQTQNLILAIAGWCGLSGINAHVAMFMKNRLRQVQLSGMMSATH